jgi:succinate-acetate transporter protein
VTGPGDHSDAGSERVRIVVRPLATALPLGLFAFGIGMVLLGALELHWIGESERSAVGWLLITFVFPLELAAGVTAILARDSTAATVLTLYAGSWLALGVGDVALPPGRSDAIGFFLAAFSAVVFVLAAIAVLGKPLLSTILFVSAARALLQAIFEFSGASGAGRAAGVAALVLSGLALYGGSAFLLEDVRQRRVLPVFRRGGASAALEGSLSEQLDRARGEAGVRQQL